MPDRCKKLQRKRKVDPAKKSAYKKSCLDKKSFGCSDEDYKECLKKYREKFPPDELDLKICENECKVSDDPSKCLIQCSIDYPMDKFEKSDPCEGIKKPLGKDSIDKFKEGMGVLIRREFTIKRPVPIFRIGEEVKYKKDGMEGKYTIVKVNTDDNPTDDNNTSIELPLKQNIGVLLPGVNDTNFKKLIDTSVSREDKNKIIESIKNNNINQEITKWTDYDMGNEWNEKQEEMKKNIPGKNNGNKYWNGKANKWINWKDVQSEWIKKQTERIKSEYIYQIVNKIESLLYKSPYTITYDLLDETTNEIEPNKDQTKIYKINVEETQPENKREKYEVESVDKETKIVSVSDIDRLGTQPLTFKKGEKVYLYECGVIDRVHKEEHDVDVKTVDIQYGTKSNKNNTVGVDMNDAIPYFKEGDNVNKQNDTKTYKIKEVTTNYVNISNLDDTSQEKIIIIREECFNKNDIIFEGNIKDILTPVDDIKKTKLSGKAFLALLSKTWSDMSRFVKPFGDFIKEEGKAIGRETAADLYDAMGTKKGNDCKTSTKKYVGLLDIDLPLPYSIKPSFIRKLSVSQKEELYKKFKTEYKREGIKNKQIRTLKPFSKKFWAMYNRQNNKTKPTLKEMNKVHNELIKLKKCGCLKENAPVDKCNYLNKTLKYFQHEKEKNNRIPQQKAGGGNQYGDIDSNNNILSPNNPVMKELLKVKQVKEENENTTNNNTKNNNNTPPEQTLVNNKKNKENKNKLLDSSIQKEKEGESNFKEKFVKKLSERLDSKRSDLYKERVMVMKGQVADGKDIKWYQWNYIKTIPLRLRLFWALRWGQIITITLLYISFKIYHKNKNFTFLVILLLCTNVFYEMYTGTSNTLFKFLVFTILSIFILIILQGVLHILGKNSECSSISVEENINLSAYQNDLYLFSIMGLLLFLISIRGLCNFVPWLNFDWILYKIGFFIYIIQLNVSYHGEDLSSPIGNVAETFFILCSFNALYQYLYFPDTKGDEFKLKNLSRFGDVLQTEYYMSQLPSFKNE